MRGRRVGRRPPSLRLLLGAALAAVVLASCSSGPSHTSASTSATSGHVTTTTTDAATTTTAPATTGALTPGAPIELPFSAGNVTAAESPDGAVFAAPQTPTSSSPSIAWVVDGNTPAVIAEHISQGIAALAADGTNFYVATYATVQAFNRSTGNAAGQWNLPPITAANASDNGLVGLTAAGSNVVVTITQGNTVRVYAITPTSTSAPKLLVTGLGAVVGSDGTVYYETTDHHLNARRPSGTITQGPVLADKPNGEGGGVQYVGAVAGGYVWVNEPAGQGLDASYTTYSTSTLAEAGSFDGSVTDSVADTSAGPLVLEQSAGAATSCPQSSPSSTTACVARINQTGSISDPVAVGAAVLLLGPSPAVVASDTSTNQFELIRLS